MDTVVLVVLVCAVWLVLAAVTAVGIGRAIHRAETLRPVLGPVVRSVPRAAQHPCEPLAAPLRFPAGPSPAARAVPHRVPRSVRTERIEH